MGGALGAEKRGLAVTDMSGTLILFLLWFAGAALCALWTLAEIRAELVKVREAIVAHHDAHLEHLQTKPAPGPHGPIK